MKIKFEIETKNGKKFSFTDLKKMAKEAVGTAVKKADEAMKKAEDVANETAEKAAPKVQNAQEKVEKFVDSAIDFADKAFEKVEDYIDQKLADEKNVGPDDITEEFFESDPEETDTEDVDAEETGAEETVTEDTAVAETASDGIPETKADTISFEEFLDEIVDFEETDEEPDVSKETECFLDAIQYFSSDVSKSAFKAAVKLPKVTYACVIDAIKDEFPEMSRTAIRNLLQADFKNWVNVRYPDVKEDCPNANCMTLMKYWAKKFSEF